MGMLRWPCTNSETMGPISKLTRVFDDPNPVVPDEGSRSESKPNKQIINRVDHLFYPSLLIIAYIYIYLSKIHISKGYFN